MFVVLINETNGIDVVLQLCNYNYYILLQEIPCEINTKILIDATSTGFVHFEQHFNDLLVAAESEDEASNFLEEEYELQNED